MRNSLLLIFFTSCFYAACTSSSSEPVKFRSLANTHDTTFDLKNKLGKISLAVPNRYDTFFNWTQYGDCLKCGYEKFRFQPKHLPIFPESGYYWHDLDDSIDQLTIEYSQYIRLYDGNNEDFVKKMHKDLINEAGYDPIMFKDKLRKDTVISLQKTWFSIITAESYDSTTALYAKSTWGTTLVNGNIVKFKFALLTKKFDSNTINFNANAILLLDHLHILDTK